MANRLASSSRLLSRGFQTTTRVNSGLTIPYVHTAVTPFTNGVPVKQVRPLAEAEKRWDFWTSSDAFRPQPPKARGLTQVPYGETWIVESFGKYSKTVGDGIHVLIPGVHSIKTVKASHPVSMGVISRAIKTKSGKEVDAYAVVYFTVKDPVQSAYYVDPTTSDPDSERALARVLRTTLASAIPNVAGDQLSSQDVAQITEKLLAAAKSHEKEFGLEVHEVEVRGTFSSSALVADKLRALEEPIPDPEAPGQGLAADYWAEVISPPFFNKRKFGSQKEVPTATATTLEWSLPSPPEVHHFNQLPKYVLDEAEAKAVMKK